MKWWDRMPWSSFSECWALSQLFHSPLSLSSRGSSVLHCAISVVSSAYQRLSIFLPAILIPACVSSSPAFLMMYSAYKLNKQGDNIQTWRTPFPIWNQSVGPCPVLTVASWPAYKFLKRQIRWSDIPIHRPPNRTKWLHNLLKDTHLLIIRIRSESTSFWHQAHFLFPLVCPLFSTILVI